MKRSLLIAAWCGLCVAAMTTMLLHATVGYVSEGMALSFVGTFVWMTITFAIARHLRRLDVADAAWGINFIIIAALGVWFNRDGLTLGSVQVLVLGMVLLWGVRLSLHIGQRLVHEKTQDARYTALQQKWRQPWGVDAYLRVFVAQAALAVTIAIPIIHIGLWHTQTPGFLVLLGGSLALFGIIYETIADRQLHAFVSQKSNKGKILTTGLRRYSRYPNYFGELCMWWGMAVIALDTKHGWVGMIGALTITYLLRYVSGVPLSEKSARNKPDWPHYAETTNLLVPGIPKNLSR